MFIFEFLQKHRPDLDSSFSSSPLPFLIIKASSFSPSPLPFLLNMHTYFCLKKRVRSTSVENERCCLSWTLRLRHILGACYRQILDVVNTRRRLQTHQGEHTLVVTGNKISSSWIYDRPMHADDGGHHGSTRWQPTKSFCVSAMNERVLKRSVYVYV